MSVGGTRGWKRRPPRLVGLVGCLILLAAGGCSSSADPTCPPSGACTRVLFLGNSYTYVNDLPSTFAHLAQSGGLPVQVDIVANGGETLSQHAASSADAAMIASRSWTYVVLQEQSDTPAFSSAADSMYAPARTLADMARGSGSGTMLFMTWAHRDGEPDAGLGSYEAAQEGVDRTYLTLSGSLGVPVAPVGYTWLHVHLDHPGIDLWQDDGSHPTAAGTYLAACVFYAAIFRRSPEGLSYYGGASASDARILQTEAAQRVLDLEAQWGLG